MSIRKKLFLAFVAAAGLPLAALVVLAQVYLGRARVDVDERFVSDARQGFRRVDAGAREKTTALFADVKVLGEKIQENLWAPAAAPPAPGRAAPPRARDEDEPFDKHFDEAINRMVQGALDLAKRRVEQALNARLEARIVASPPGNLGELSRQLRAAHPMVLGVKVVLDGTTVFSDLPKDFAYPAQVSLKKQDDSDPRAPFEVTGADGRWLVVEPLGDAKAHLLVEIDPRAMVSPAEIQGVHAFYLGGSLAGDPEPRLPQVAAALASHPLEGGEITRVRVGGERWRVYAAPSADRDRWGYGGAAPLLAAAPESLLEAPLVRFRAEIWLTILFSLTFAIWLSYYLSGRFGRSIETLRRGVAALSRGEFAHLEKASGDELGGELVESMNRMASALAERTRREEIENWRRLVRVLSHEINNTLGPVKSVATTVRDQISPKLPDGETSEDLRAAFRLIVDRVDSLSSFISGYAVLAKLPPPERAPADLNQVTRDAISMLRESAGRIAVEERYDEKVGTPAIDKEQIERVAINLVKNALEAARGKVWVSTVRRGDVVELIVEDDGPGIAPEARAHLFVPYYTTKPGGSGIGLALARQIVLGHGGTVGTEDRAGGGTTVRVILPSS